MSTEGAALRAGALVGNDKYEIVRVLGEGSSGRVYEAVHKKTRGRCAIKLLRQDAASDDRARMLREAQALARLDHPNIVRLLDYDDAPEGSPYAAFIVQELVEGRTLRAMLDHELVLTQERTLELLLPVLDALAYAHERGVVHRDVKPENIVLAESEGAIVPKLIDFGLAREVLDTSNLTRKGTIAGTPRYMSPEQAWGRLDVDARSDLWSMGVVLYECLSGVAPYDGANEREVLASIVASDPPHLRSVGVAINEELADAVMLALTRAPEARCPSASALMRALRKASRTTAPAHPSPGVEVTVEEPAADDAARVDSHSESERSGRGSHRRAPLFVWAIAALSTVAIVLSAVRAARGPAAIPVVTARDSAAVEEPVRGADASDAPAVNEPVSEAPRADASAATAVDAQRIRTSIAVTTRRYDASVPQSATTQTAVHGANAAPIVNEL